MKLANRLVMTVLSGAVLLATNAMADSVDTKNQGYLVDTRSNIVMSGAGLCWRTSDWTPARAVEQCDPTLKPVAAAQLEQKPAVIAQATTKAMPQKVSFSGDTLFDFDKSTLKPEGIATLDGFVSQMHGTTVDTILVTGHADRFGSATYNQKLSERRAIAVKDYLISKNVQASYIEAEGKGETQPVTKLGDCKGKKSKKVVACLQPDRRVDIEIKATKMVPATL